MVFISGSREYFSDISLPEYKEYLEKQFPNVSVTLLQASGELNEKEEFSELAGLEALDDCDVVLLFTRRLTIQGEQIERIKKYIQSGKPLVALRTTSHGLQNWLELDKEVLGGNYHGHYGGWLEEQAVDANGKRYPDPDVRPPGKEQTVEINPEHRNHPVLKGITDFTSRYSLYKTSPVASDVTVLMFGKIPDQEPEPAVWVRNYNGSRISYIAPGGLEDWKNETFRKLVTNTLFWTAGR